MILLDANPAGEKGEQVEAIVKYVYETLAPIVPKIVLPILLHGKPEDVTDEDFEAAKIHGYEYFNNKLGDKEFLTGDKPTWADFLVFSLLMQMDIHPKTDKVEKLL